MDIELAQALAENELLKSMLYCTKRSCNNCGKVNCENFQRQRKDCCENWVSYKDYIKELEQKNHAMLVNSLKICNQSEIDNDENERKIAELEAQIEEMKRDVKANIRWADENKNNQMYCKLNAMINQWEIKENDRYR